MHTSLLIVLPKEATPTEPHPKQELPLATYPDTFGGGTRRIGPIAQMKKVSPLADPRLADMRTLRDI